MHRRKIELNPMPAASANPPAAAAGAGAGARDAKDAKTHSALAIPRPNPLNKSQLLFQLFFCK